jgi:hypothetical protein
LRFFCRGTRPPAGRRRFPGGCNGRT